MFCVRSCSHCFVFARVLIVSFSSRQLLAMVTTDTPHVRSAAITCLGRVVYEYAGTDVVSSTLTEVHSFASLALSLLALSTVIVFVGGLPWALFVFGYAVVSMPCVSCPGDAVHACAVPVGRQGGYKVRHHVPSCRAGHHGPRRVSSAASRGEPATGHCVTQESFAATT